MSGSYANRWPFNSSTGRTFGSPFSGYRGDYSVYPDETWKQGLRKYPYMPGQSPARRHRSASPRRRAASASASGRAAASSRQALIDILAKIDSSQEDLQALAAKVARWSRQAAGLAGGLQEEALLLELSRQAAALAEAEAAAGELQKRERVVRLSRENGLLRNELRDMIRICKLLLDRDLDKISGGGAAAATEPVIAPAKPVARPASAAARPTRSAATQVAPAPPPAAPPPISARNATQTTASLYYGSEDPYGALYGGGPDDDLAALEAAEAEAEAAAAAAAHAAQYDGSRTPVGLADDVSLDAIFGSGDAALEAADAAVAAAAAEVAAAEAALAATTGGRGRGLPGAPREGVAAEVAARAEEFDLQLRQDQQQVGAALAEVDKALAELSSHFPASNGAGAGSGAGTAGVSQTTGASGAGGAAAAAAAAAAPYGSSFGGFAPTPEITPAAPAAAAATAAALAPSGAHNGDGDGLVEAYAPEPQQAVGVPEFEEPAVGTPMGTPVKLAEGIPAGGGGSSAPPTPLYQGVVTGTATTAAEGRPVVARGLPTDEAPDTVLRGGSISISVGGGGAGGAGVAGAVTGAGLSPQVSLGVPAAGVLASPTVHAAASVPMPAAYPSVAAAAAAVPPPVLPLSTPGAAALDALLLAEVEKLKRVNAALAGTLASYGHVTERLGSAATSLAAAAGGASANAHASTARALFPPPAAAPATPAAAAAGVAAAAATGNVPSWYTYGYTSNQGASPAAAPYPAISPSVAAGAAAAAAQSSWTPPRSSLRHTAPLAAPMPASPAYATFTPAATATARTFGASATAASASPRASGGTALYGEIRNLDASMDAQLYDIRQQLQELRRDVALSRVATTAASAPGGTPGFSAATAPAAAAPSTSAYLSPRTGGAAVAAAAAPPVLSYGASAVEISRMKDEIADLRRQLSFDKAWYLHSLDAVTTGRSTMFADLQRRIDDLLAPRPFRAA